MCLTAISLRAKRASGTASFVETAEGVGAQAVRNGKKWREYEKPDREWEVLAGITLDLCLHGEEQHYELATLMAQLLEGRLARHSMNSQLKRALNRVDEFEDSALAHASVELVLNRLRDTYKLRWRPSG